MEKIKEFFTYFLIFIAFYIFATVLTNFAMRERFNNIDNIKIDITSPKITVEESKSTNSRGYVKGNIVNDTGEHIKDKYLQFDFYNKNGAYIGTEVQEIKYFNVEEKVNFDIQYNYKNVNSIEISFVDEVIKKEASSGRFFELTEEQKNLVLPVAVIVGLYALIP